MFQAFPSQKAAHRQTKNSLHSCISIVCECAHIAFASLLDVLFLQCGLQKYTFQVVSFRIERTIRLSRLAKNFEVDFTS